MQTPVQQMQAIMHKIEAYVLKMQASLQKGLCWKVLQCLLL